MLICCGKAGWHIGGLYRRGQGLDSRAGLRWYKGTEGTNVALEKVKRKRKKKNSAPKLQSHISKRQKNLCIWGHCIVDMICSRLALLLLLCPFLKQCQNLGLLVFPLCLIQPGSQVSSILPVRIQDRMVGALLEEHFDGERGRMRGRVNRTLQNEQID